MTESTRKIPFGKATIGQDFVIVAGPCAIENHTQYLESAQKLSNLGVDGLRAGIFKLRTNPNSFTGLGLEALPILTEAKEKSGLPVVSEVTDPRQIEALLEKVDMFQVGTRNMYNYPLLHELGKTGKPILLKRSFAASIDEWLMAAQHIEKTGNQNIILCERGIRSFEVKTRNTLDLNAVAYLKEHTDYPVFVDPSHGTGRRDLMERLSLASLACGADGLMIECHPNPDQALSDREQSIDFEHFERLLLKISTLKEHINYE